MATSGSIDYSLNARQIVEYALKKINVVGHGQPVPAEHEATAVRELNLMLKGWQSKLPNLWRSTLGSLSLTANTQSYALTPRPFRVVSARYRSSGIDIPMIELTQNEYDELPLKSSTGTPTNYFFDPQRDEGRLYIWPVLATASGQTISYRYQRRFEDIDDPTNDLDIPQEYLEVLGYNLASRLVDDFGQSGGVAERIIGRASFLFNEAANEDREPVVLFAPESRYG